MESWIARMNIARYKRRLQGTLDDAQRLEVERLLADEEAHLKALEHGRTAPTKS